MPEMLFKVRWPDGSETSCYSPSLVVEQHLTPGEAYPLDEFTRRASTALGIASERVQAKFGAPCGRARAQSAEIAARAARYPGPDGRVTVLAFQRL